MRYDGFRSRSAFLALVLLAMPFAARAEPVPPAERIPVDLRRTTLLVRDIDASLPVYRDVLGLKVIYDELIGGGTAPDGSATPATIRLVLLRANDSFVGVLGLMQRLNVQHPPRRAAARPQAGEVILVFNATDLEERFPKLRATPGVTIATAPERVEYPAPGGQGTIPVLFSAFWDPDGYFVELNKILGTPAGAPSTPRAGEAAK